MSEGSKKQKHKHFYIRKYKAYIFVIVLSLATGIIGGIATNLFSYSQKQTSVVVDDTQINEKTEDVKTVDDTFTYGKKENDNKDLKELYKTLPIYGKKVSWYGDSIINTQFWSVISTDLNLASTNNGVGGTRISGTDAASMNQESRINGKYKDVEDQNTGTVTTGGAAIPNDVDYIIIGAGTNDWAGSVPLGQKEIQFDTKGNPIEDVTTFYQACHVMFRNIQKLRPNAKVIVLGTPYGFHLQRFNEATQGVYNNEGLTSLDYGNALCDVAEMWGFPAFRYGNYMGINESNVLTLLDPDKVNGHIHPGTEKALQMFVDATMKGIIELRFY